MERTTIYLPRDLRLYLKDAAQRSGKSQADIIRAALEAQRGSAPAPNLTIVGIAASNSAVRAADRDGQRAAYRRHLEEKFATERGPADA